MNFPSLIALSGDNGAGKTTVARCLRQSYGYEIHRFAATIKDYLLLLGVPFDSVSGTPEQKSVPTDFPGGSGMVGGALGVSWSDSDCNRRANAATLAGLGLTRSAQSLMCMQPEVAAAMRATGEGCE